MRAFLLTASCLAFGFVITDNAKAQVFEQNIDRPGSDYSNTATNSACWTWVRPGVQTPSGRCWLKNAVPSSNSNGCCISGVK
jgi:hypothetical protein